MKGAKVMSSKDIQTKKIAESIINQEKRDKKIPKPEKVKVKDISIGKNPIPVPKDPRKTDK